MSEVQQIEEESYRLLVESVKDHAIFIIDTDGHIITWNKGAEQVKGYKANEIIGRHISVFYTPDDIESREPEKALQKTKELGQFEADGWRVRKDGSVFWANEVFTAMKDSEG